MKVRVDPEICAGFGICTGIAPEVFELHDDGYAVVLVSAIAPGDEDLMLRAESQCPARAISIIPD
ncbi:ferredoxin [Novosphingobium piscinae]|uniref:Ferredoxin n=1 Tax=Novosphingobium piscinae TaxID=1507448 RepID=A0A7X1KP73_9SPHN|nr:ferredoxin [Novosphingobium piscinae]MBC2668188.1 ferredoxin [Novosphingobium piscinae]